MFYQEDMRQYAVRGWLACPWVWAWTPAEAAEVFTELFAQPIRVRRIYKVNDDPPPRPGQ